MEAAVAERLAWPAPRYIASAPSRRATTPLACTKPRSESSPRGSGSGAPISSAFILPEAALRCLFVVTERDLNRRNGDDMDGREASLRQLQLQWVAVEPPTRTGLGRAIATAAWYDGPYGISGPPAKRSCCTHMERRKRGLYRSPDSAFCRTQTIVMRSKEGTGMKRYPNEFEEAMEVQAGRPCRDRRERAHQRSAGDRKDRLLFGRVSA